MDDNQRGPAAVVLLITVWTLGGVGVLAGGIASMGSSTLSAAMLILMLFAFHALVYAAVFLILWWRPESRRGTREKHYHLHYHAGSQELPPAPEPPAPRITVEPCTWTAGPPPVEMQLEQRRAAGRMLPPARRS